MTAATRPNPQARHGFTLLEVMLASVIAVMLMAALYTAMEVQLRYAQAGREVVDQTMLVRQIFAHVAADLNAALTPITATPTASGGSSSSGGTSATTGTGTTGTATAAATTTTTTTALNAVTPFSGGLIGDNTYVAVWVSKLPQPVGPIDPTADSQETGGVSDVRRIAYWLDGGLRKQTLTSVTANDDSTALPPPSGELVAAEVVGLSFQYYDGSTWADTWDGTQLGADGATPIGPPRAIKIEMDITNPHSPGEVKHYIRYVSINSANAQPVADTTTGGTTTGGGMTP
jgi:prepilin-type N-terminal cleavage/methylation domain-containing protein